MHELRLFGGAGLTENVLQGSFCGVPPNSQSLGRFLAAEPRCHGKQHAQLARGQAIKLGEGFAGERWHPHWLLHEDRCRRSKCPTDIPALAACQRENSSDKTGLLPLRNRKRKT